MNSIEKEKIEVAELVIAKGFLTGSRKFKVANKKSDWDYVIFYKTFHKYFSPYIGYILKYRRGEDDEYDEGDFRSFNIYIEDEKGTMDINVLVPNTLEIYYQWKLATKATCKLPKYLIKHKQNRIKIFELFKSIAIAKAYKLSKKGK